MIGEKKILAKKFYFQHCHPNGFLHSHLPNRQSNPITAKLRNAKQIPTFKTRTAKFKKSFIPFAVENYNLD